MIAYEKKNLIIILKII